MSEEFVWIFSGSGSRFPSGVFLTRKRAEAFIREYRLTGVLTAYPVDSGVYEWALSKGYFHPSKHEHRRAEFIQSFTTASQEHYHYEDGYTEEPLDDDLPPQTS